MIRKLILFGAQTGSLLPYGGATAPSGYLLCDGSAVSRATYARLFSAIGVAFGVGDGSTTFNVPDLRGRFPLGKAVAGTGSTLGGTGGAIDHTHAGPAHTHTIPTQAAATTGLPSSSTPTSLVVGAVADDTHTHQVPAHDHGGASGSDGSGATGNANAPFQSVNYIIKT